jgi:prepilin-type processing-associated H-X9-DG protein
MSGNLDGGANRLKLDGHVKLLDALQNSRAFTMILPRHEPRASTVEAAILAVLNDNERFPENNSKRHKVHSAAGSKHLSALGRVLSDLGNRFEPIDEAATRVLDRR